VINSYLAINALSAMIKSTKRSMQRNLKVKNKLIYRVLSRDGKQRTHLVLALSERLFITRPSLKFARK